VTVEKQNIDLEMTLTFTLREIIEIAEDPKSKSVSAMVKEMLARKNVPPAKVKELIAKLDTPWDPADGHGGRW
jgi:hypothetical protein